MPSPNRSLVDDPISISRPREPTSNNALQPVGLCRNAGNWRFSRARLPHRFWLARAELARGSPLLTGCVHDLFLACSVSKMEAACPCVRVGVRDGHPRACKGSRQAAWRVRPTKGTAPFPARPDVCEPRACLCPVGRSAPVPIPPPRRPRHRLSSPRRHRAHRPAPRRIAGSPLAGWFGASQERRRAEACTGHWVRLAYTTQVRFASGMQAASEPGITQLYVKAQRSLIATTPGHIQ